MASANSDEAREFYLLIADYQLYLTNKEILKSKLHEIAESADSTKIDSVFLQ